MSEFATNLTHPRMRRRTALVASAALGLGLLSGCGLPERVVGLHDAPVEQTSGAPYSEAAAADIVARGLAQADRAFASADSNAKARKAILTGPALRAAEVSNRFEQEQPTLTTREAPQVLAISAGRGWPRHILATTKIASVQYLHVLLADGPTTPYKLWVSAPMLPGTSLPALPPIADGVDLVEGRDGVAASTQTVLTAYGRLLDVPTTLKSSKTVADDDAYAVALREASAAQKKALGALGTFTREHHAVAEDTLAFRLADGSAVAFGQMTRTDRLAPTAKAKRLDLPSDLAKLADTKSVTESLRLRWLMTTIMVIPTQGQATIVGVGEQLRGISGR